MERNTTCNNTDFQTGTEDLQCMSEELKKDNVPKLNTHEQHCLDIFFFSSHLTMCVCVSKKCINNYEF